MATLASLAPGCFHSSTVCHHFLVLYRYFEEKGEEMAGHFQAYQFRTILPFFCINNHFFLREGGGDSQREKFKHCRDSQSNPNLKSHFRKTEYSRKTKSFPINNK